MTQDNTSNGTRGIRRRYLWWIAGALVLIIAGAGWAVIDRYEWRRDGPGLERFVEKRIDRMLERVDATESQRTRIRDIVDEAIVDMQAFRSLKLETWQALLDNFKQETINREALENLRQKTVETMDQMSRRMVTALADAAEILTPEQRNELIERMDRRR